MGYTVDCDDDLILVRHTGGFALEEIEASRREAAELAAKTALTRILVDCSAVTSPMATADIFGICASHHLVLPPGVAVAIVYAPAMVAAEDAHFAETVSANRGVALRSFTEPGSARKWLARSSWPRAGAEGSQRGRFAR